jgi:hypothetical protein
MVLLHEASHIIVGLLVGLKLNQYKIYRMKGDFPVWNGFVQFKYEKMSWKWVLALNAPYILLLPLLFMWLNTITLFIGLYILSTPLIFKGDFLWLTLPSKGDKKYLRKIEYYTYVVKYVGESKFNAYLKANKLNNLIFKNKLLCEEEFFIEKENKSKNKEYKKKN